MCGDWNFKLLKSIRNSILINFSISEFHQAHTCISIICYILNRATIFNFFFPFKVKIKFDSMVLPEISFSNHSESIAPGGKFRIFTEYLKYIRAITQCWQKLQAFTGDPFELHMKSRICKIFAKNSNSGYSFFSPKCPLVQTFQEVTEWS